MAHVLLPLVYHLATFIMLVLMLAPSPLCGKKDVTAQVIMDPRAICGTFISILGTMTGR